MAVIKVKNLKKYFGAVKAVDDISFSVSKGEIVGFLGPNGAGKTTTIRCMMDFLRPDKGKIQILQKDSRRYSALLKKNIGYLSGEVRLHENWTGQDHINLVKNIRDVETNDMELIEKLDFNPSKRVHDLSTGNKQKLGLILALMHKPKLLVLDEPTVGLDPLLQDTIYDILKDETRNGTTVFLSSHNLAEVERICDRVVILKQGKIVAEEKISDLKSKRMYTVHVYFEKNISGKEFSTNGIQVTKDLGEGLVLQVKGDIRPLLKKLNKLKIKDIEIRPTNLEEVFLEFYK
jgi:ABC-2 type transport system ATP-binding protein